MAKRTKQTEKTVFEVGDFVLAKIKGYPHWPAQVTQVINSKTKPKYVVKFFRTEQIGTSFVDIKPYNASDPIPQKVKPDILKAYEECKRIYEGCTKKHEMIVDTSPPRGSPSEPVDCSLNDLTGEQANADRGIEKPSPKSEVIVPETNKTIEKLKKKLQEKLVEKEDKKKNLREKKEFEKASNILPKFIKKFQSLTAVCEKCNANPNDEIAERQLKVSITICQSSLEQLNKCVIALSSEYGRKQKETEDFHNCLSKVVTCLRALRDSNNETQNSDLSKVFLKKMKKCKKLLEFINSHGSADERNEQQNAERKENARKRIKLSQ